MPISNLFDSVEWAIQDLIINRYIKLRVSPKKFDFQQNTIDFSSFLVFFFWFSDANFPPIFLKAHFRWRFIDHCIKIDSEFLTNKYFRWILPKLNFFSLFFLFFGHKLTHAFKWAQNITYDNLSRDRTSKRLGSFLLSLTKAGTIY